MEETALEFKNTCPYILPENDIEDEGDQCVYETLEKLYRHTIFDLEHTAEMEFFIPQYKLLYTEMEKFFIKSRRLRESNKYLQSELNNTIAELQAMQKLSAIDKEMIEQLKEEMERKWNEQTETSSDDEESKASKRLYEQINTLSLLVKEKDGIITDLQDALDTLSKMRDSANVQRELLLQENKTFKQELTHITKVKQSMEEQCLHGEKKLKELLKHLQTIDAELLAERNEKEQLRNEIINMASEVNAQYEKCQKLEQELQSKSADTINLKNEDYAKLCAEFEEVNVAINDLTEQRNKQEEEIEKLKELLDKSSCDVKHLEKTVKTLEEMNDQLTRERKVLASMLKQYEKKYNSFEIGNILCDSHIQEEDANKCGQIQAFCNKSIFDQLTEQCEKRCVETTQSSKMLKQYSGTLRDVITGLEEQLEKL